MKLHLRHLFYAVTLGLLGLTSCQKDVTEFDAGTSASQTKILLGGEIVQENKTRVNDSGFCDGDQIGIFITDYTPEGAGILQNEGNRADNVRHTFSESANRWIPSRDIYWKDTKTHIDVYGFYPHSGVTDVNAQGFEVQLDQRTTAEQGKMGGYEASDFLWAKATDVAPPDRVITLKFGHKMSFIKVRLQMGSGWTAEEWAAAHKQVVLRNMVCKASVDMSTGEVTPVGGASERGITPYRVGDEFRAVVIPQTLQANTPLFTISVGESDTRFYKKSVDETFMGSKLHTYDLKVKKNTATGEIELESVGESITLRESDAVSHDAMARAYIVADVQTPGTLKET